VRLAWVAHVSDPSGDEFEVLVDAHTEDVLLSRRLTTCAVFGLVEPGLQETGDPRQRVPFPPPRAAFPEPAGLPPIASGPLTGFPWPWVRDTPARLRGNNAVAWTANSEASLRAQPTGAGEETFDPPHGQDQRAVNAFYACNLMHDFFYLLGFDEGADAYQRKDRVHRRGPERDEIAVEVYDAELRSQDGSVAGALFQPTTYRMQLGLWNAAHTALDVGVVAHEYAHAVSARLVDGGGTNRLSGSPTARAMNEGYSDYFAVTVVDYLRRQRHLAPIARFGLPGMRTWSYFPPGSSPVPPLTLGEDQAGYLMHALQAWCAALLHLHEEIKKLEGDDERGEVVAWRLVVSSLKALHPANASARSESSITLAEGVAALERVLSGAAVGGVYGIQVDKKRQSVRPCFQKYGLA
jgi:extracellular elastinolytic metalloproteinase